MKPCVYTIILNTNKREDTLPVCVRWKRMTAPNFHTIVLDNASIDDSVAAIQTEFPQVR